MCGFAGFLTPQSGGNANELRNRLRQMCDMIRHRGPDGEGYWIDATSRVALGHRRLAILDLSPAGRQPMVSPNGRMVVCFNGELYNHHEVRAELESKGYRFRGHSDTETLAAACQQWGLAASLPRFAGMFAIALWDIDERCLYFARDRMGEKPLYYGRVGEAFAFASEIKAIARMPGWSGELEPAAVQAYFECGYVPAPWSIYRGIRKLSPGTWLRISLDAIGQQPLERPYWCLEEVIQSGQANPITDPADAIAALDVELNAVVRQQMESDVPLGAFLSGGIDSSCIVAIMQRQTSRRIRTFTIGFDDTRMDESAHARAVAAYLGTDHTELRVTGRDALELIPTLPAIYDEPFADQSQLPTVLLAALARRHVVVSLSGDGGDELFAGYAHYQGVLRLHRRLALCPKLVLRGASRVASRLSSWGACVTDYMGVAAPRRLSQLRSLGLLLANADPGAVADVLTNPNMECLVAESCTASAGRMALRNDFNALTRLMAHDQRRWLPDDILVKVDRAAMAASLESRAPLLDRRIVELAWRMPSAMKLRGGVGKWILRQVLYRLAPAALFERPKQGFCIPIAEWLSGPLKPWAMDVLRDLRGEFGILDGRVAARLLRGGLPAERIDRRLWTLLMFEAWLRGERAALSAKKAA